jgi:hypothetical protein
MKLCHLLENNETETSLRKTHLAYFVYGSQGKTKQNKVTIVKGGLIGK